MILFDRVSNYLAQRRRERERRQAEQLVRDLARSTGRTEAEIQAFARNVAQLASRCGLDLHEPRGR